MLRCMNGLLRFMGIIVTARTLTRMIRSLLTLVLLTSSVACAAATVAQPEAAGTVTWLRNLDAALAASAKTQKPVFALFQEIPGCAGCRQFGRDVLSNPLLVDAIENEFTPLLIHNNMTGYDAAVLSQKIRQEERQQRSRLSMPQVTDSEELF